MPAEVSNAHDALHSLPPDTIAPVHNPLHNKALHRERCSPQTPPNAAFYRNCDRARERVCTILAFQGVCNTGSGARNATTQVFGAHLALL